MPYQYRDKVNNVYMLDTRMFGFPMFQSSYLVAGDALALIDAGPPASLDIVKAAIGAHGFSVKDITHIFVTHCEHPDHSGNVGALLQENTRARVYIHPMGAEYLIKPEIEAGKRSANLSAVMAARFGHMVPVPPSRIEALADGDSFDLGQGEELKIRFTPGHQPTGIVIEERKNKGLFINDLPGAYFADAEAAWIFTPFRSDIRQAIHCMTRVSRMDLNWLYLGHFGISDKPSSVIRGALDLMQELLNLARDCISNGQPQQIQTRLLAALIPEAEKIREARGDEALYTYLCQELLPSMCAAYKAYALQHPTD